MNDKDLQDIKSLLMRNEYESNLKTVSLKKPKEPIILFFGREDFCDNSKYLYLDACANNYGFKPIWCSFNSNLIKHLQDHNFAVLDLNINPQGVISLLIKAPICVFCINPNESLRVSAYKAALAGAKKIQLWHGVGTKKLDLALTDQSDMTNSAFVKQLAESCQIDYMLSPAKCWDHQWKDFFGVKKLIRAGMPRNVVLTREPTSHELIGSVNNLFNNNDAYKILWTPTYTFLNNEPNWLDVKLYEKITSPFKKRNLKVELLIKPHPYDRRLENTYINNPFIISPSTDIYPHLRNVDLLITDMSSIFSDFLICDKPIVFLKNNKVNQLNRNNIFIDKLPGIETDPNSLDQALEQVLKGDTFADSRRSLLEKTFETSSEIASKEINSYLSILIAELLL
jgi:CDP-glycerol glycerophosphotransferase (TagB/SpsB family)